MNHIPMNPLNVTPGLWRQRDGAIAEVLVVRDNWAYGMLYSSAPMRWRVEDGISQDGINRASSQTQSPYDLVTPASKSRIAWIYLEEDGRCSGYATESAAQEAKVESTKWGRKAFAIRKIILNKGEGLT